MIQEKWRKYIVCLREAKSYHNFQYLLRITKKFRYTSFRYAFSQNFDCIHIIESDPDDSTSIKLHCELYFSSTELSMFRAGEKCIKFYEEHNFGTGPTCKREIAISRSRFRWIKKKRYVALIHLQQYCIRLYLEVFCTTCIRTATCSTLKRNTELWPKTPLWAKTFWRERDIF